MPTYLYELHAHTSETSGCGRVPARKAASLYHEAGYDGLAVTDHFCPEFPPALGRNAWKKRIERFLRGYRAALERGSDLGLTVLLGMEIRFLEGPNDYLVYGPDESFYLETPGLLEMGIARFHHLCRQEGFLVYQAHPYRDGSNPADPRCLDGVEVLNRNPRHDSRNNLARAFALRHGLGMLSGSDFHQREDLARGGIETSSRITDMKDLLAVLRGQGEVRLIGAED